MDRPSLLLEEDLYTAGNERPKPSAPLDIGKLRIKVDWTEAFPDRWRARLQIALQTWLSKLEENATVHSIKLMDDPSFAEVQITPSTALEALEKLKFIPLRFKNENREVTAWICPDGATYVNVPHKSLLEGNRATLLEVNKATSGTSEEANKANNVENITACIKSQSETETNKTTKVAPETSVPLILPLHLSWYMHNAYRKDLETIGKRHGVFICPEVSIAIKPTENSRLDSVSKATEDYQKLLQRCADGFSDATVHHNDMDSDIVKNAIDSIKSQKTKLMFTLTDSDGLFLGPKKFTDMIKEETRRRERQSNSRSIPMDVDAYPMDVDSSFPPQSRPSLLMSTRDLPTQLEMDEVHWDLMKLSYKEHLSDLEAKYGVSFTADLHQGNLVKVQARSKGDQHVNLEGHAVRALTHLYQKLASAAVSCELRKPADQTDVRSVMEKLQQRCCVVAAERLSRWRLTGLPEHLGPAIAETEKILQRKVFDDKMKTSIGYSEDIPYARGIKID
nr:uncharacterized protein si:dkey-40c23.1 isoform X2 [Danio rerio]|eukprot:XP_009304016.1 uncharacterized protein si:dkey-40c23.1 isoform X2 [Danio rerio]